MECKSLSLNMSHDGGSGGTGVLIVGIGVEVKGPDEKRIPFLLIGVGVMARLRVGRS